MVHKKNISDAFSKTEINVYETIKERPDGIFTSRFYRFGPFKLSEQCFELNLIYPAEDQVLIAKLSDAQKDIRKTLHDTKAFSKHFYPSENDFHITLLCHTYIKATDERFPLSAKKQKEYRENAKSMLFGIEQGQRLAPKIHFFGGCATQNAVIIHGYKFAALNELRNNLRSRYNIYSAPNIAHISLIHFSKPVEPKVRASINERLKSVNFGETTFSKLGLYEFDKFSNFSGGDKIASIFLPSN